jgi:O-antigen/teichoic acid export membrane protein
MKRPQQLLAMAVISCNSLAPQLAALLTLAPRDFGIFSLGYLTYSLAASVGLSTVSEAYVRAKGAELDNSIPRNYAAISSWLSAVFAIISGIIFSLLTNNFIITSLSILAVGFAARRTTIRYHELRTNSWHRLLTAESTALIIFIAVLAVSLPAVKSMVSIFAAWSTSGLAMWLLGTMRNPGKPREALDWITKYRGNIRQLLGESLLQETSAIGAPYIISPILGPASFGVYRAVSNFSAPVRLVFNFIRPYLASRSLLKTISARYLLLLAGSSLTWGVLFSAVLLWVAERPSGIAMLDALAEFWLPTGVYMIFTVIVMYFYVIARTKVNAKNLWHVRVLQTVVSLVLPITGAGLGGLSGAIWGYALGTVVGAFMWITAVYLEARHRIR